MCIRDSLTLRPKEGLAIMNGTSVMTALACLALDRADYVERLATRVTALSVWALHGNPAHFEKALFQLKGHPGPVDVAARLWRETAGEGTVSYTHLDVYKRQVPGIVQLKWVMDTIEDWWGTEPILQRLEAIKFKRTLRPSQFFTLQLNDISDARQKGVAFTYQDGNMIISSGRVIIE